MTTGQDDISIWVQNKLGTSSDTWNVGSIVGQLNSDILEKIVFVFRELHVHVSLLDYLDNKINFEDKTFVDTVNFCWLPSKCNAC